MGVTVCSSRNFPVLSSLFSSSSSITTTTPKSQEPICFLPFANSFTASFYSNPIFKSTSTRKPLKHVLRGPIISRLAEDNSEGYPESKESSVEVTLSCKSSVKGTTVDIKLPRRSLLVKFTCNACGYRSQKLINRVAYERGTVFVQCSGCFQHHKLVDNLGLVVEYDFREEIAMDSNADQI